jgi:F420-dependent oxidoreductase-like protein
MKMSFGVQAVQQGVEFAQLVELWRFLDSETHFDGVFTMDHLVIPVEGGDTGVPCFESWMLLAAAARETRRVRLGCLVSANTFRHPALLAKMAATLDHASDGRLTLGLGAGWHEGEHRAFGIHLGPVAERQDRLEEAAAILRAVLDGKTPVSFTGRHYRLEEAQFSPGFVQRPGPPLLIGGGGERRTLRTVARYADVANLLGPVSEVKHKLDVLREHCAAVGRDYDALEKTVHVPLFVHEDPDVVERVAALLAGHHGLPIERVRGETPVGSAAHVREVMERYGELGITGIVFPAVAPYDLAGLRHISEAVVAAFD